MQLRTTCSGTNAVQTPSLTMAGSLSGDPPPFGAALTFSVAVIAGAALAYEILLIRLFSIIQWHHFAYMIISMALLGVGASGTFLSIAGQALTKRFTLAFAGNALGFGLSAIGCFVLAQHLPFNALAFFWGLSQFGWLVVMFVLLMVPFFFAANCVALSLLAYPDAVSRVYSADLLGAGVGSAGLVLLLFVLTPVTALRLIAVVGMGVAALTLWRGARPGLSMFCLVLAGSVGAALPPAWIQLEISPFKGLPQILRIKGAKQAVRLSSPLGDIAVVENTTVPFRHAPGLSLGAPTAPGEQVAVYTDADALTVITRRDTSEARFEYLDFTTSALPYHLLRNPAVLVLGAGGGTDVLQALQYQPVRVEAVELNEQVVRLVRQEYRQYSGNLYGDERVRIHIGDARGFVMASARRYDLIQVALLDSFNASAAGLYALNESHLYTVEAFQAYLARLRPGGLLALTRWVNLPPRDGPKLFATAVAALRASDGAVPDQQIAWIRGWNTATLLVKNGPFTDLDVKQLRAFAARRSFDVAYYPGMTRAEANRFNQLDRPYFFDAAQALLGDGAEQFFARYKFDIRPATDDRPYFSHFFRWAHAGELFALRTRGGAGLLELGYLVLVATLLQAMAVSMVLIVTPLWLARRRSRAPTGTGVRLLPVLVFFSSIGLAFLFVEIALIQKFVLLLGHPLYAVAVVLSAFLVWAGVGSRLAGHAKLRTRRTWTLRLVVSGIGVFGVGYLSGLPLLADWLIQLSPMAKIATAFVLIAPIALLMGMPFALGLQALARSEPSPLPWAWAINGCASVIGAVLATVLAIHLGFNAVLILALGLYALAALTGPHRFLRDHSQ